MCNVFNHHSNLEGVHLESANLEKANLTGMNLRNAKLKGATIRGAIFKNADISWADLSNTIGESANFTDAIAIHTSFHNAKLESSIFIKTIRRGHPDFDRAGNFNSSNFESADLIYTKFESTGLGGVKFRNANLLGASGLDKSYFLGTEFGGATWIDGRKCDPRYSTNGCIGLFTYNISIENNSNVKIIAWLAGAGHRVPYLWGSSTAEAYLDPGMKSNESQVSFLYHVEVLFRVNGRNGRQSYYVQESELLICKNFKANLLIKSPQGAPKVEVVCL